MRRRRCRCPSCNAGLTCYRASREVADSAGRPTRRLLWGDAVQLNQEAAAARAPFDYAGTHFVPTRNG